MTRRLARSAGLIGLATLSSRVLGLVRDMAQAHFFGTGVAADAFAVATRIPTLLRDLFAEGAMSAAFVPTFTRYLQTEGQARAWRLGSQVLNALLVVTGILVVAGIVFAEPIARYYATGYTDDAAKFALTVWLTRVNMPFLLLVAAAAACMGMLNALRRFGAPAAAPALYNIAFIVCTIVLTPIFVATGIEPALSLSLGMLLGGVVQIAAQWPALRREGYRHRWVLDPRDPALREVLLLMGPGTIGVAAAQINLLVNTSLATHVDGANSALGYAFRLMYMPIGIIGVSVATAAIPEITRHATDRAFGDLRATVSWGVRLMLMLSVPATVGLMVLARPIVALIYERGAFDPASTALTTSLLFGYAPGIVGYSIVKIASPSFYAMRDARTPVMVSLLTIATNLALNLWLFRIFGVFGLALGTAIAANLNALLLLFLLARRIDGIDAARMTGALVRILLAAAVMGVAVWLANAWLAGVLPTALPGRMLPRLVSVLASVGAGIATLALAAWVLRIDEFQQAVARMKRPRR